MKPVEFSFSVPKLVGAAGLAGALLGAALYRPQGPDVPQSAGAIAGAFGFFVAYACAQVAWGSLVCRLFGRSAALWERFFWGSAFFAYLVGVFGFLPLVGAASRPFWIFFLVIGCVAYLYLERDRAPASFRAAIFDGIAALAFGLAALGAFSPHAFWDSLWYHLTASRFWFEAGHVHLPELFPVALKTGLWDYHFLFGQILLGDANDGGGLIAAQLFGQWAALATAFFSYVLLRTAAPELGITAFAALGGALGTELFLGVEFAKNDWAAVFWGLATLVFFARNERLAWIAAAAGLCFAAKYSSAFFLALLLAGGAWRHRARPRALLAGAAAFLAAVAPLLARNLFFTGDPFFPALHHIFPTASLGPTWENIAYFEGVTLSPASLREKLGFLLHDSKAVAGLFVLPLVWGRLSVPRWPLFVAAGAAFLFLFGTGPKAEWRLLGAPLVLLAVFGAGAAEAAVGRWVANRRLSQGALALLALAVLPIDWNAPARVGEDPALRIRGWASGAAMAWVRLHAEPGAIAATLNESRIYYLFPHPPVRAFDQPRLDQALAGARTAEEIVRVFRAAGIRYLVLSAEFLDRYFDRRICDEMYRLSERNPGAVRFRSELSRVLDLGAI